MTQDDIIRMADMTDKLRQAIKQAVAVLGPEAPLCSGCVEEWTEALRILNEALMSIPDGAEPQDPVAYNGWVLREVLFDNGEPVGHKEPQQEPVGWVDDGGMVFWKDSPPADGSDIYTAPQPAKPPPLAIWQIAAAVEQCKANVEGEFLVEFARAIEAAHGIGEKPNAA